MKPKIAVIGCGEWGRNLVRVFYELGCLLAINDFSINALNAIPEPVMRVAKPYLDERIDAVAIATPSETHYQIAKDALQAGKDVFVEKPMCQSVRDAYELVELAEKNQRVLMVGHVLLYDPVIQSLKKDLEKLGDIEYIFATRLNLGRVRKNETVWWSFAPHDIALVLYLLEQIPTGYQIHGDKNCSHTILTFASGVKVYIYVSWLYPYKVHKFAIKGKKEYYIYGGDWKPGGALGKVDEPLRRQCQHFIDCIVSRGKPLTDGEHGLKVVRVLENCQERLNGMV